MARLFLGIPLPGRYGEMLGRLRSRWAGRLRSGMRWTRPENWHLTLVFLGEMDDVATLDTVRAMEAVRFEPFSLQGSGFGFFPARGRPRVAWIGLQGDLDRLDALKKGVDRALAETGFQPDSRPFVPHLTLARIRTAVRDTWDELRKDVHGMNWPEFTVRSFLLWESELHPSGAQYTVRRVFSAAANNE